MKYYKIRTIKMQQKDEEWMALAIEEAILAFEEDEVPIGAVAVCPQRGIIAKAHNQTRKACDPCAHAELEVIRQAAKVLGNYRLNTISLYVTLEPCAMCAGAIVEARIKRLIFAARDFKAGAAGTVMNIVHHSALNHQVQIVDGLCADASIELLQNFFAKKRLKT
jgi:tRNA(adenine34) deaminase